MDEVTIKSFKNIGNYLLTAKDGVDEEEDNHLYCLYEVKIGCEGFPDFTYYWYAYYDDLIMMNDGTCAVDLNNGGMADNDLGCFDRLHVKGYDNLDSFYYRVIVASIDRYEYQDNLQH